MVKKFENKVWPARHCHGVTPLHLAVLHDRGGMVALLLAHGSDVNAEDSFGITPADRGEQVGNERILRLLNEASS